MNRKRILNKLSLEVTWLAIKSGGDSVKVVKQFGKAKIKIIEFVLTSVSEGIHIHHPNYEFISKVSHFCAVEKDIRLSLNKTFLSSIIKSLKKVGLWEAVVNKDFLKINKDNSKSNKKNVSHELKKLLR